LTSDIHADRIVRLGQDKEDEVLRTTHQSAYCHNKRIREHQVVFLGGDDFDIQDLEYWAEGEEFHFRLLQDRRLTAKVVCR
jgi:hypothetical protein